MENGEGQVAMLNMMVQLGSHTLVLKIKRLEKFVDGRKIVRFKLRNTIQTGPEDTTFEQFS